jgi:hypothetical protein
MVASDARQPSPLPARPAVRSRLTRPVAAGLLLALALAGLALVAVLTLSREAWQDQATWLPVGRFPQVLAATLRGPALPLALLALPAVFLLVQRRRERLATRHDADRELGFVDVVCTAGKARR